VPSGARTGGETRPIRDPGANRHGRVRQRLPCVGSLDRPRSRPEDVRERGHVGPRTVRARGEARGRTRPSEHRPHLRLPGRGSPLVPRAGILGRRGSLDAPRRGPAAFRPRQVPDPGRDRPRSGIRARPGDRAPGHQAVESAAPVGRVDQDLRLRNREVDRRRPVDDSARRHDRFPGIHGPRADRRGRGGPASRRLRDRDRRLRALRRPSPLPG
jgi:hypothetical protein